MVTKGLVMGAIGRLLAGPILSQPKADTKNISFRDINIHSTPNFPVGTDIIAEMPEIEIVRGTKVRGRYLGWTQYPNQYEYCNGRVEIPDFSPIMGKVSGPEREIYGKVRQDLIEYIGGHEFEVELAHKPQSQQQHGRREAEYLRSIEGSDAWLVGLALHKERLEHGDNEEKWFSKYTNHFYGLEDKFELYGDQLDELGRLVTDVMAGEPTYFRNKAYQVQSRLPEYSGSMYQPLNVGTGISD